MPTPLPAIVVPDNTPTLNAYRVGQQDRIAQDERNVLKEAGGLAAAGNMGGARSALYKGGNFGEARNVSGELRAQSAEGRAQSSHLRSMQNDKLERTAKTYEMFGRLIPTIKSPEQLEMAKQLIKQRTGLDLSSVTMEQLPMLHQQGISQQQQLENEMSERKALADKARADQAQSNTDRSFGLQERQFNQQSGIEEMRLRQQAEEAKRAQTNQDRTFGLQEKQFENTVTNQTDVRAIMRARADAAAKTAQTKANTPKPLTEGQAKARGYVGELEQVNNALKESLVDKRGGSMFKGNAENKFGELGESPVSSTTNSLALSQYTPAMVNSTYLNKKERQFLQQAEQFISVLLYHRSGAQISSEEFSRNYRIYFPQPGDDLRTRRYKAEARKNVIGGMRTQGAYDAPGAQDQPSTESAPQDDWSDIKILSEE